MRQTSVLVGIQARSSSKRFPNKAQALVGDMTMTERVLNNVYESVSFLRTQLKAMAPVFFVALLVPEKDQLKALMGGKVTVMEGDESDVLSRYYQAMMHYRPDYIVKLNGDTPMLPDFVISKHIRSALYGAFDYVSNVDERFRTAPEGFEVEVISRRLLRWAYENATTASDREQVTTVIRRDMPEWAKVGHVIDHLDYSSIRVGVDSPDDLDRVRAMHDKVGKAVETAKSYREKTVVFRL